MRQISYLEAIKEAIREEFERDKEIFLMGEDIGKHGGAFAVTKGLWKEFGDARIKDTPISENTIIGCAVGAAITGMRPVVEIMFVDFIPLAMDQIVNAAAKLRYMTCGQHKVPLVIRAPQGGGGLKGAGAQHSQSLESWFVHTPGLKVVLPSTPYDAKGLLKSSIRDDNPVLFLEHKNLYSVKGRVPEKDYLVPLGKAEIKKKGRDVSLIANGVLLHTGLKVAEELEQSDISVEVIDPRTYKPLDMLTIADSVKKTHRLVIAHEACNLCGMAAEIGMTIVEECFDYLDAPIRRIGSPDVPIPFDTPEERIILPGTEEIHRAIKEVVSKV